MTSLRLSARSPNLGGGSAWDEEHREYENRVWIRDIDLDGLIHALELLKNPGVDSVEYHRIEIKVVE